MFTNEQLKALIRGEMVGEHYPFCTNNDEEVEAHIKRLYYGISRIPGITCEAVWDNFGSGYASFVEYFCYRKEDVTVEKEENGVKHIDIKKE